MPRKFRSMSDAPPRMPPPPISFAFAGLLGGMVRASRRRNRRRSQDDSARQRGPQQSLAMVLAIGIELVVEGAQIGFDGKGGIKREHAANMPGGAGLIAKHGRTGRKECIVELVGATNAPERVDRFGVAMGNEERST